MFKSRRAIVAATVFLSVTMLAGCSTTRTLNTEDVQAAISKGLTDQIGGTYTVTCPADIEAKTGGTFVCDVVDTATGETAKVTGTQTDDQGKFTWEVTAASGASGAPSPAASPAAS